jgi:hypothetical protein
MFRAPSLSSASAQQEVNISTSVLNLDFKNLSPLNFSRTGPIEANTFSVKLKILRFVPRTDDPKNGQTND